VIAGGGTVCNRDPDAGRSPGDDIHQDTGDEMDARRKFRILQVGALSLWKDRGDSLHARELAFALRDADVEPILLNLPGPKAPADSELHEVRAPVFAIRFLRQLSWNVTGTIAGIAAVRRFGLDVVYSRMEPGIFVGLLVSLIGGRPLIVEINGLPTEDVRLYRPNNAALIGLTRIWERTMYGRASKVLGAVGYIRYIQNHFGVPEEKCIKAPLGVNTSVFTPLERLECLAKQGREDVPTVIWAGVISAWQGLAVLVDAVEIVAEGCPAVQFVVVGGGITEGWLRDEIDRRGLARKVSLVGQIPYGEVNEYLGCATVCVATFPGNRGDKGTISSLKTLTYLASGRPVVTNEMDEMGRQIQDAGAGLMVPPDDARPLAAAILTILGEDHATWRDRCAASRRLAESQTWRHKAEIIAGCLGEISGP
jgi:glycosyltransferase involved in cell wall biosynthesis